MNIVTIDPSQNSTAICVNGELHVIAKRDIAVTKSGSYKKWFKKVDELCEIHLFDLNFDNTNYNLLENSKLTTYSNIAKTVEKILTEHNISDATICIEGYSFSSASGKLIDLVTIGTLIRCAVLPFASELIIMSPSELKANACELTYPPTDIGKRKPIMVYQNNEGVKGGSFKKHEMFKAITENNDIISPWATFLSNVSDDVMNAKDVPKPIDDLNDAYLLYQIIASKI